MSLLVAKGIRKTYGATVALNGVDFTVHAGAVNVLIGENGAGKSTLMKILAGIEQPTAGHLLLNGAPIALSGVRDAEGRGISIVHQELSLCSNLTVAENIFLGRERSKAGFINKEGERAAAADLISRFGQAIAPHALVETLKIGQQQIVEIARALAQDAQILILDEPTSALSPAEVDVLFGIIGDLKARGIAIVYISHKLEELLRIGDHITVLRDGNLQATAAAVDVSMEWIVRNMLGKGAGARRWGVRPPKSAKALSVRNLCVARRSGGYCVNNLSLDIYEGQIVAIYGLLGSGRTEFFEAVAGLRKVASGAVRLGDEDITSQATSKLTAKRVFLVPEDRQREGLFQNLTVGGNLGLSSLRSFLSVGLIDAKTERSALEALIGRLGVKAAGVDAPINSLSGGNQQKVVIGRCVMPGPRLLLIDEPGRGVDIGAREEIFERIREQSDAGTTVVFSTSDLYEALTAADRIIVFAAGTLVADTPANEATEANLVAACNTVFHSHPAGSPDADAFA